MQLSSYINFYVNHLNKPKFNELELINPNFKNKAIDNSRIQQIPSWQGI